MNWRADIVVRSGDFVLDVSVDTMSITHGRGARLALIGPNGAGKTTLLRTLAGARRPVSGRITVAGRSVFDHGKGIDVPPEARRVGYVPQGYGLFPHLTVAANAIYGWRARHPGASRAQRATAARQALERFGCEHLGERRPKTLSGGERQRVALARAMAVEPQLLLLDEPLAALDIQARREVRATLGAMLDEAGCPAVIATHDPRDVHALCDAVAVIEGGRLVAAGPIDAVAAAAASPFVAEFFALR